MSLIVEVSLLISGCLRACLNGSSLEEQVEKYDLSKEETAQLKELLELSTRRK